MKTENDAFLTLAALCAQAEHCQYEMLEKMRRWELPEDAQARVMAKLVKERLMLASSTCARTRSRKSGFSMSPTRIP